MGYEQALQQDLIYRALSILSNQRRKLLVSFEYARRHAVLDKDQAAFRLIKS